MLPSARLDPRRSRAGRLLVAAVLIRAAAASAAPDFLPDRRRPQFSAVPGYAVVPYAYSLPGIGWGYGVLGAATNVAGTRADVAGTMFFGDVDGQAVSIDQVHLIPERLMLDAGAARLGRATIQSYAQRGMGASKDDYSLAEFADALFYGSRLTGTFSERRFEGFAGYYAGSAELKSLRDRRGGVIASASGARRVDTTTLIAGLRADMTDDFIDPRRGLRLEPSVWRSPRRDQGPDYYFTDWSVTAYLPLGRRSTWAFNYLRSDAHVIGPGETDPAALARSQGLDCAAVPDAGLQGQCLQYLATLAAQNGAGTATMLGGFNRLRSYPEGRFKGAHAEFLGSEIRWNLTDEVTPFDIYLVRDIRTAVQLAFFYEIGSVADSRGELWRSSRYSAGSGVRIVTASGLVYRLDGAFGQEGFQPSVFFQYPWEL